MTSKNKLIKNTSMLYLLSIAKMIIPLITLPYLTRVLSVPEYGVVAYVKAAMTYMQIIIDFGFLLSGTKDVVLAGNDQNKINKEVSEVFFAKIALGIIALFCLFCITPFIRILRENLFYTFLSYISVFLTCFLMDFYFRGIEKMEIITMRFLVMKGIATILTFIFVKSDSDILMIPILDIIGTAVAILFVWRELKRQGVCIVRSVAKAVIIKLKESAIYFLSNMATTAFSAFITILIGIYIDEKEVAFWSICIQLVSAVQSLYSPITNGVYPHMVRTRDWELLKKTTLLIMPIIIAGCIFTYFFAKPTIIIIAGEKYKDAAVTLKMLIPVLFFSFPAMLYGWPALGAINRQKETTVTTIVTAFFQILVVISLIILKRFNLITICIARNLTEVLLFLLRYFLCLKYRKEFVNYNGE